MSKKIPDRRGLGVRPIDLSQVNSDNVFLRSISQSVSARSSLSQVQSQGSSRYDRSGSGSARARADKRLDIPETNSSKSQEELIERAIKNISKLPETIEQVVSRKIGEPKFQKALIHKATKTLNVPKSGRIYHDLLDIHTVPTMQVKRATPHEQKPLDPSPLIMDYNKIETIRIPPLPAYPPPVLTRNKRRPNIIDPNANFDANDLLRYERMFSSI